MRKEKLLEIQVTKNIVWQFEVMLLIDVRRNGKKSQIIEGGEWKRQIEVKEEQDRKLDSILNDQYFNATIQDTDWCP